MELGEGRRSEVQRAGWDEKGRVEKGVGQRGELGLDTPVFS